MAYHQPSCSLPGGGDGAESGMYSHASFAKRQGGRGGRGLKRKKRKKKCQRQAWKKIIFFYFENINTDTVTQSKNNRALKKKKSKEMGISGEAGVIQYRQHTGRGGGCKSVFCFNKNQILESLCKVFICAYMYVYVLGTLKKINQSMI